MGFRFEDLDIWKLAVQYASKIYKLTDQFPQHENFGLRQQTRRAAVSVSLNIAEGAGRGSDKDFSRFLNIAVGSVFEVVSGFAIALERKYISNLKYEEIRKDSEVLCRKIGAFRNCLTKETVS